MVVQVQVQQYSIHLQGNSAKRRRRRALTKIENGCVSSTRPMNILTLHCLPMSRDERRKRKKPFDFDCDFLFLLLSCRKRESGEHWHLDHDGSEWRACHLLRVLFIFLFFFFLSFYFLSVPFTNRYALINYTCECVYVPSNAHTPPKVNVVFWCCKVFLRRIKTLFNWQDEGTTKKRGEENFRSKKAFNLNSLLVLVISLYSLFCFHWFNCNWKLGHVSIAVFFVENQCTQERTQVLVSSKFTTTSNPKPKANCSVLPYF